MMSVVVAAAARTPWGKYQGQLASVSAWQLGQIAVETAVKQSTIPVERVHRIFMNETPETPKNNESEFIFSHFIKKAKYTSVTVDGEKTKIMESFVKALEFLKTEKQTTGVVGGLASATKNESVRNQYIEMAKSHKDNELLENYISESIIRYKKSQTASVFDFEVVPLTVQQVEDKRRSIREITKDEINLDILTRDSRPFMYCDGAAAVVLTTTDNAKELKLSPLAVLKDYEYLQNSSDILSCTRDCVENLFSRAKLDPQQIKHWEIEDRFPQVVGFCKHHFNLNYDLINPHGGSLILGYSPSASFTRLLTHITHSLKPLEYGCVICTSYQESLALIIQKLPWPSIPDRLPLLTLYTKDACHLCDILLEELELNFSGEYQLEKVFIDAKDNLRFLRLYRFDIPVLFLNNQFVCMHRLNHLLLRKRLDLLKNNKYL